jgi:cytochrome c-type biogenesis protein CcmF
VAFGLCAFSFVAIGSEFARGSGVYRRRGMGPLRALNETVARNRRRYGGYVIHLGVLLIVIGFAGAAFNKEVARPMEIGESIDIGGYTMTYADFRQDSTPEKSIFEAEIEVTRSGEYLTTLYPQRNVHLAQGQPQSEVGIRTTPVEDLYVVVSSVDPDGTIGFRAFVNPLTWWIWAGAVVMLLGMWVVLSGDLPVAVPAAEPRRSLEPGVAKA